jgi:L-aspartate oxidase
MAREFSLDPDWMAMVPRYLVAIEPSRMMHYFTDVLIIGGGLAGLRAAHEISPELQTVVVTKDRLEESNSAYAQGGIASVWDPEDRFDNHVQDTLTAGGSLCDPEVVAMVVREAPARVAELMEWGTRFDAENGALKLGREGGHSHQRIIHALGDATGKEIMRAMMSHTRALSHVQIWEATFTIDLLTHEGRCCGAVVSKQGGPPMLIWAKETILCTGGCGQVFRESTNPRVATGDGHAVAFRAGAKMRDMEFMQFHPTVLYIAGSSRTLITEAVRGEGAYLIDVAGHRFMRDYDSRLELAPRTKPLCLSDVKTSRCKPCSSTVSWDRCRLPRFWIGHYQRRYPGSTWSPLHGGRSVGRSPGQNDAARFVGGGRSDEQRIAWCQSIGFE